jgi:GNAT superfamily N-acetyltransferase
MSAPVSVRKVETKADLKVFLEFPWTLYKHDPYWVPPLVDMQRHKLDKRKNPAWQYMEGDYFIAWRGDQPVGTIAAVINHRHNDYQHEHIGFFGMFEVYDDPEAAHALLSTAAEYVRAKGYDAVRGPASFSTNDECGLLIKGYDDPPVVLMPYNFPYYQRLIESAPGFDKVMDVFSYHVSLQDWTSSEKLEQTLRVTRKNSERRSITVRSIDPKNVKADLKLFRGLYNQAWEANWGFVPMSDAELDALIHDLGQYLEPRLACFASVKGEPVAFMLAFPDLNQPLKAAYAHPRRPALLTLLRVVWHWKVRSKINRIRIALLGVREGYRGIGVEAAMLVELYEQALKISAESGWSSADAGWVLETNEPMKRLVQNYSGEDYKHYRFYERKLI